MFTIHLTSVSISPLYVPYSSLLEDKSLLTSPAQLWTSETHNWDHLSPGFLPSRRSLVFALSLAARTLSHLRVLSRLEEWKVSNRAGIWMRVFILWPLSSVRAASEHVEWRERVRHLPPLVLNSSTEFSRRMIGGRIRRRPELSSFGSVAGRVFLRKAYFRRSHRILAPFPVFALSFTLA